MPPASSALCVRADHTRELQCTRVLTNAVGSGPQQSPSSLVQDPGLSGQFRCAVIAVDRSGWTGHRKGPGSAVSSTLPDSQVCGLILNRPVVSAQEIALWRVPQADRHRCGLGGSLRFPSLLAEGLSAAFCPRARAHMLLSPVQMAPTLCLPTNSCSLALSRLTEALTLL